MSLENANQSLTQALLELFGNNGTSRPTVEKVIGLPAIFRGAKLIAGKLGRIPCQIVKRSQGISVVDDNHYANWLLTRPNTHFGKRTLFVTGTTIALLEGNFYAEIIWNNRMEATALNPLDSKYVTPILIDEELFYKVKDPDEPARIIPPDRMLHIKNLTRSPYVGISVVDVLCESLSNSLSIQRYSSQYFKKQANVGYILETPGTLDNETKAETKKYFKEFHQGIDSPDSFGLAFAQGGSKLVQVTLDAEKAQLLQSKEFDLVTLSNVLGGVPPHKLGSSRNSSYSSYQSEEQAFLDDCISDWLDTWAEEIELKLLTEEQKIKGSHCVDWDTSVLVKADIELQHKIDTDDLQNGVLTLNELLAKKNRPAIDEDFADMHRMPQNIGYAELLAEPPAPAPVAAPVEDNQDQAGGDQDTEPAPDPTPTDVEDETLKDRYEKLVSVQVRRLNTRLEKAYKAAYDRREDVDIDAHAIVFVENLGITQDQAATYIRQAIAKGKFNDNELRNTLQ